VLLALEIHSAHVLALDSRNQIAMSLDDARQRPRVLVGQRNGDAGMRTQPVEDHDEPPVAGALGEQPVERDVEIEEFVEPARTDGPCHRRDALPKRCKVPAVDRAANHRQARGKRFEISPQDEDVD